MEQIDKDDCWVGCGKEGECLAREAARLRGLAVTNKRVVASFAGGPRTLKRGTQTPEAAGAELLLLVPF